MCTSLFVKRTEDGSINVHKFISISPLLTRRQYMFMCEPTRLDIVFTGGSEFRRVQHCETRQKHEENNYRELQPACAFTLLIGYN